MNGACRRSKEASNKEASNDDSTSDWRALVERHEALAQTRVLKPAVAKELERLGVTDIQLSGMSLLWCLPTRWLIGRKA